MRRREVFDADGHVFERDPEIFEYLDPPFRGRKELLRRSFFPPADRWNRTVLSIAGRYEEGSSASTFRDAEGEVTAQEWLDFLDEAGIEGTVLYPTAALGFGRVTEVEWAICLARAYNRWLQEKFLSVSTRLRGMALIPIQSPVDAAAELRRVAREPRMVGAIIVAGHLRRPLGDPFYYPVYEAAQELDTVVAVHAGGPGNRFDMFDGGIEARCLGHPTSLMIEMTSMMFSGIFDRFPRLRFSFMEGGVAWVLFLLERMQEAYDQWSVQAPELKREPREHLTSGRVYFHCELDEGILRTGAELLGERALLYASDFPHISTKRILNNLRRFQDRSDLSEEIKAQILGGAARRLYKVEQASTG
jgi:predicted TIM-barrel fold metal-dependent hydrolase